ncbi:cobalt ABC transporter ATPase [Alicyclobacillus cellulosilyticus]|uniref:Cobalt ABC transporter ATPase n=1 Tax=Alicyclobacillus cellulosilyticus TaxID=1003997 RepID=A0A917K590_9BACL|nr:ATP-binding cassette domain-containing protein [Alicyclobacillus cellulosilyticus]GGI99557.1 cobalt ABC transporter ATPase [Alicyclobacillus cellulosilyticus]
MARWMNLVRQGTAGRIAPAGRCEGAAWREVHLRDLTMVFADGTRALDRVSLAIPYGQRVALVGAHESGKTTLLEVLAGRRRWSAGEVVVDGKPWSPRDWRRLRAGMALVAGRPRATLFMRTVWEYVTAPLVHTRLPRAEVVRQAEVALAMVGMQAARDERLAALHRWPARKVALAAAMVRRPHFLLVDDPTDGLDPQAVHELTHLLQAMQWMGVTVMVATHDVDFAAAWAEAVTVLCGGRVLASGDAGLLVDKRLMEQARLRLPLVSLPFALVPGRTAAPPRTLTDAVRELWEMSGSWEGVV